MAPPATVADGVVANGATAPVADSNSMAEWALFGGLIGVGGLAVAAALVRRRRPRPDPTPEATVTSRPLDRPLGVAPATTVAATAPLAFQRAPVQPVPTLAQAIATKTTTDRAGPDRMVGRHEAMVDFGPTPDNPFLTRRNRLRRAHFLDRQEAAANASPDADWGQPQRRAASMR